jgi:putative hydrolase of the HAD superfamily
MVLKAITFDLDGTLYPEYKIALPSIGVALRYPRLFYFFNEVRKEIRTIFPIENFKKLQVELLAKRLGKSFNKTEMLIENIIYGKWLNSIRRMKPYSGMRDLIISLRSAGYKCGLLSDLPVKQKLSYLGLEDVWDFAFSSEETGYLKPNSIPFKKLIDCVEEKPENILYIGNNYEYDIVGAKIVGLKTAYFSRFNVKGNVADFTFKRFRDLQHFLLSLL